MSHLRPNKGLYHHLDGGAEDIRDLVRFIRLIDATGERGRGRYPSGR